MSVYTCLYCGSKRSSSASAMSHIQTHVGERCDCDCDLEMPYDPNDPGAYPGPDEDCDCFCHEGFEVQL